MEREDERGGSYLSLERHQLHVQLTEERVGGGGAAGDGHHVLLGEVHAFRGAAAGALVVPVLQGVVLPATQRHLRVGHHRLHLVLEGRRQTGFELEPTKRNKHGTGRC